MSDPIRQDQTILQQARERGGMAVPWAYIRLAGPGWLGSAFTLGAGSLAGSLFLGVIGGYTLLWVQPLAMLLGVVMLGAISYVALSLESSPFAAMRYRLNPVLAWSWLLGALGCNMIWSLPQYSLAFGAITNNLFPSLIEDTDSKAIRLLVSLAILVFVALLTFGYSGRSRGIRVYENALKVLVAIIVLSFLGVVLRLAFTGGLPLAEIASGLVPNWRSVVEPAGEFSEVLATIDNPAAREYWRARLLEMQRECMIGAASSAVAVNMCFLVPFSLLAKKWNRDFRGLALFDLATGTFIPFILATGAVVIAAASQFHTKLPADPLVSEADVIAQRGDVIEKSLEPRRSAPGLVDVPVSEQERRVAFMLLRRDNSELAQSLRGLFGDSQMVQIVFGVGVLAMALSTISILMLISGFAICEAFEVEHKGLALRLGTLCPAVGVLWPFLWEGESKAYLAVSAAAVGFTLLPMAYVAFFLMMNSARLLGDDAPRGIQRIAWNTAMGIALVICGGASVWTAWHKSVAGVPAGRLALLAFLVAILLGHVWMKVHKKPRQELE